MGRTGSGKSTLLNALTRLLEISDPKTSSIEIDGINIMDIGLKYLR